MFSVYQGKLWRWELVDWWHNASQRSDRSGEKSVRTALTHSVFRRNYSYNFTTKAFVVHWVSSISLYGQFSTRKHHFLLERVWKSAVKLSLGEIKSNMPSQKPRTFFILRTKPKTNISREGPDPWRCNHWRRDGWIIYDRKISGQVCVKRNSHCGLRCAACETTRTRKKSKHCQLTLGTKPGLTLCVVVEK